jgi:putative DNA primase/helicase
MHLTKGKVNQALHRVMGSVAFTALARSVLVSGLDPADEGDSRSSRRVLAHAKCNVGPLARSLAYAIEGTSVAPEGEPITTVKLTCEGECDTLARDVLSPPRPADPTETDEAEEWLRDELADGEWHVGQEVKAAARAAGISEKPLRRAREDLGVEITWRQPAGPPGRAARYLTGDSEFPCPRVLMRMTRARKLRGRTSHKYAVFGTG